MSYLYLIVAIITEVIATILLKNSDGFRVLIPTVLSILSYIISFYFMSLCLRSLPMGVVYAIWSGVGIVLISFAGFFIHKQKLDLPAVIGITLIIFGVVIMKLFSKSL